MPGGKRQQDLRTLLHGVFNERDKAPFLALNALRQFWPDVVGAEIARRTHPSRIERGTLWIASPDACWAYELQFFKRELLSSVQTFIESHAIHDLRFCTGQLPPAGPDSQPPVQDNSVDLPQAVNLPPLRPAQSRAASAIADPGLRAVFQRSMAKQQRNRDARTQARKKADSTTP